MSSPSVPRRRNGKPQACEPCRKRKLACGHENPICKRCMKRGISNECFYHAAPMTRTLRKDSAPSTPAVSNVGTTDSLVAAAGMPAAQRRDGLQTLEFAPKSSTLFSTSSSFLGPNSFSSVFWENQNKLAPLLSAGESLQDLAESVQASTVAELATALRFPVRTSHKVLSRIPTRQASEILLRHQRCHVNIGLKHCHDMLWSKYGHILDCPDREERMDELAQVLHKNAQTMLKEPEDPEAWQDAFSGENMRWEALGLLFGYWAFASRSPDVNAELFTSFDGHKKDRKQFMLEMKNSAGFCADLCSETDMVNPLLVNLLYTNNILLSTISGDTSVNLWRNHGDLMCATTALGLHRENERDQNKITIGLEMRRRVHWLVFAIDKGIASFTGRPPLLSPQYCSAPLPTDVADHVLLLGKDAIEEELKCIDENGWNTRGEIYHATKVRMAAVLAEIRGEILEISLSHRKAMSANKLLELKGRSGAVFEKFPSVGKLQPGDFTATIADDVLWAKMSSEMRHGQNEFLLEQLLFKSAVTDGQSLLDRSRKQLSLLLVVWTDRDRFMEHHIDYEWIVMCYGIPPAGVLCMELLKQSKGPGNSRLQLPRSETIQNLSLTIGFLDWIRPGAGNYQLCQRMRGIISRVLDQVLEGPLQPQAAAQDPPVTFDFDIPVDWPIFDELGNINYLDTFDWVRTPWTAS